MLMRDAPLFLCLAKHPLKLIWVYRSKFISHTFLLILISTRALRILSTSWPSRLCDGALNLIYGLCTLLRIWTYQLTNRPAF
jgi:hypothetical protein